jgi:hypothetical protein
MIEIYGIERSNCWNGNKLKDDRGRVEVESDDRWWESNSEI